MTTATHYLTLTDSTFVGKKAAKMKARAALLLGALLCILFSGSFTKANTIIKVNDESRSTEETVTTVTSITRLPTTHLTETPPVVTTSRTTKNPMTTTETPVTITHLTTERTTKIPTTTGSSVKTTTTAPTTITQQTSEPPVTITHLTTERTTKSPTTQTPVRTTTVSTTVTRQTSETLITVTHLTTHRTTRTPTTYTPTTTQTPTTKLPTTHQSTTVTPGIVTHPNDNPTSLQTGGTEFPIWSQTTDDFHSTSKRPMSTTPTSGTTKQPTTSHHSASTGHSTDAPKTTVTTHHPPTMTTSTSSWNSTPFPTPTMPPPPRPPSKYWNVLYGSNGTNCLMVKFAAQIDVTYVTVDNKTVHTGFDIPSNASVNEALSMCDKTSLSEVFALDFASSIADGYLVAIFKKNSKTNASSLFELMVSYPITEEIFPGISPEHLNKVILLTSTNLTQFETDPMHCYTCNSKQSLKFTSIEVKDVHDNKVPFDVAKPIFKQSSFVTRDLKIQSFLPTSKNMNIFMTGKLCDGDKPDTLWTVDFIVAVVIALCTAAVLFIYYGIRWYKKRKGASEDTLPILEENVEE